LSIATDRRQSTAKRNTKKPSIWISVDTRAPRTSTIPKIVPSPNVPPEGIRHNLKIRLKSVRNVLDCAQTVNVPAKDNNMFPRRLFLYATSNHKKNLITAFSIRL
jgi:hypothetical protein